ncbi:plasmid pRiA4b ORF-3 family protein [Sulfitobacter sp. NFXS29]|uniref:plasmid pRiA4b ORF-3 family protein n=1 Tax=Sulfitobacter sp. NFXS29 TaxID=2818438 RepID=UPI0032DF9583
MPASKTSLFDVIEDVGTKTIRYIYDSGDNWHHVIRIEKIDSAIAGAACPRLVRAIDACPPEDVGGFPGYADLAMVDPKHEEHGQMLEWYWGQFDPDGAKIGSILDNFERVTKKLGPEAA